MNEELKILIEEKIYQLKNDLNAKEIEAKTMAEFAAVFYEKYRENYDEKLFVQICKRTMNFYNDGVKNLPDKNKKGIIERLKKTIPKRQEKLINLFGKKINFNKEITEKLDLEEIEIKYNILTKEMEQQGEKKPFFLCRKNWKMKLKKIYEELEELKLLIEFYEEEEKNREDYQKRKKEFKILTEDLKEFVSKVDKEIGPKLAKIPYEEVIESEKILNNYVYEIIIANLYNYFIEREK